jgi:hypothetical protein
MGRKVTDGLSLDFAAPAATLIEEGEIYRVDGITHFAVTGVLSTDVDRGYAGDVSEALYRCKVPVGIAATRGDYLGWSAGAGFKAGGTDLALILAGAAATGIPAGACAQVEGVRNSRGYATLRLVV